MTLEQVKRRNRWFDGCDQSSSDPFFINSKIIKLIVTQSTIFPHLSHIFLQNCSNYINFLFQIEFPGVREYTFHKLLCYLYTDEIPAVSAVRCVNLLELANRLCLPRLVNLVERRVIEDLECLQPSEAIEQCLRLLEPVKVIDFPSQ